MLCRVLLTIIAVSCTFSREIIVHAHDQSTQRLVQIKDVICVLLLSGLQKEELDVSMLEKLQRHNVNIEDINNENLHQECITRSTFAKVDRPIEITTEVIKEEIKQNKSIEGSAEAKLQTMIRYLIGTNSDKQQTDVSRIEVTTEKYSYSNSYTTSQVNGIKSNLQEAGNNEMPSTKNSYAEIETMSGIEKADFQKFLKLWNMYNKENMKDRISKEIVTPIFKEVEKHTTRPNTAKPSDNEKRNNIEHYIVKLITDYISKNKINPTTIPSTSTQNVITDTISHQIDQYLAANNDNTNLKENNSKNLPFKLHNLLLNYVQIEPNVKILQENNQQNDNSYKESVKNKVKKLLNNILWTGEQSNEPVMHYVQRVTERPDLSQNGIKLKAIQAAESQNNDNNINRMNDNVKQIIYENNNIKHFKIPLDVVKEIAESVKAIVLKDLKNNLSTVTPKTIILETTTDIRNSNQERNIVIEQEPTTFKQEHLQDSNNMMEKFMELFQQFKTMNDKPVLSKDANLKPEKKLIQHEYIGSLKLEYPPSMTPINPYGVMMPMAQMTPIFTNPYNQNSNSHTPYVHESNKNNNLKSVHKITQVNIFHPKSEPQPLTIQTNSYEIPPLGIPVPKPINVLNQNIVVTTKNPYMRSKTDRQHGNILHKKFDERNPNDWFNTYDMSNYQHTYDNFNVGKFKDSNRDNRFMTRTRERQKYTNDYNDNVEYRSGYSKPHYNKSDYNRMRLRNNEIKKFHERLEKTDDSNIMDDDREECCGMKVASRQQRPLNDIKNRSRYDDTHFKNFLKTQQKVNDMLERILATKTKSDGPRSVEIP